MSKWRVDKRNPEDNTIDIVEADGYPSMIAKVSPRPHYADNQMEHANLIASAPTLLAALKEAWQHLRTYNAVDRPARVDKAIMDAIAAAEGRETPQGGRRETIGQS